MFCVREANGFFGGEAERGKEKKKEEGEGEDFSRFDFSFLVEKDGSKIGKGGRKIEKGGRTEDRGRETLKILISVLYLVSCLPARKIVWKRRGKRAQSQAIVSSLNVNLGWIRYKSFLVIKWVVVLQWFAGAEERECSASILGIRSLSLSLTVSPPQI